MSSFLIPIGLDLGHVVRFDRPDEPAVPQLRAQQITVALSAPEHRAWRAAHVPTDRPRDTEWTRGDAVAALADDGVADGADLLDSLVGLGLVAELTPHTDENTAFATRVRLVPRVGGLEPEHVGEHTMINVGPIGDPVDQVPAFLFDLFAFGARHETLAEAIAHTVRRGNPEDGSPRVLERSLLEAFLFYAPGLISRGAIILDQVPPPAEGADDD